MNELSAFVHSFDAATTSSKPRITVSVDSPGADVNVTVTVRDPEGEERQEIFAGSSGDRVAVKAGGIQRRMKAMGKSRSLTR